MWSDLSCAAELVIAEAPADFYSFIVIMVVKTKPALLL